MESEWVLLVHRNPGGDQSRTAALFHLKVVQDLIRVPPFDAFLCRWSGHVSYQLAVPDIDTENSGGITYA